MNRSIKAGLAGALTLTLLATQALAANRTTTTAGAACAPDNETDDYFRESNGFTLNSGSDVHCPVFLDSTTTSLVDTDVFVDLPVNTSATCFIIVRSSAGSIIASGSGSTTSDVAGADIDFDPIDAGTGTFDSVSLRCALPDGGRLISYAVNED